MKLNVPSWSFSKVFAHVRKILYECEEKSYHFVAKKLLSL